MSTVIKVENLGKKYTLRHQQRESYTALRDVIASGAKNLARRFYSPFVANSAPLSDTQEEFWALKDVSFEVKQGDRVGIIGRNGAGKSTLLKILSRITEPTEGRIGIKGRVASLLEVGTGFHPELTGRENIYLNGAILGMSRADIKLKFDEIVAFAEVEKFLDTPVKRYSSGMYVRLAFAVAAHLEPEILIVDEVLAVGDAQFQKKCLGKMEEVGCEGRTVLFVSHNMAAVQKLCTSTFCLISGRLAFKGDPDNVVNEYFESSTLATYSWQAPKMDAKKARICSIQIIDEDNAPTNYVTTGSLFRMEIVLEIALRIASLQLSVGLLDEFGSIIFGSSPLDSGVANPSDPGVYRAVITFPEEILLSKHYGIRTVLWSPEDGAFDAFDGIRFFANETKSLSNSTPGGRLGFIAVRCNWSIDRFERSMHA